MTGNPGGPINVARNGSDRSHDGGRRHPDALWPVQIARALRGLMHQANLAREAGRAGIDDANRGFRFLIRDRDSKFTAAFDAVFTAIDVRIIKTPVRC